MPTIDLRRLGSALLVTGCLAAVACTGQVGDHGEPAGGGSDPGGGVVGGNGPNGTPLVCTPGVPQTSQLPRLTHAQYDNTIRDLLGIAGQPSSMLAPDTAGSVDLRAWDGFQTAAETVSAQLMTDAAVRAKVIPCTPSGDGSACARQMIEQFGKRALRRPLTTDEVNRFLALYTNRAMITPTGSFNEAAQVILKGFLVSPSFLTRAEIAETPEGDHFVLSGYEVASRLSYMLWGSMPDDALFAAAEGGQLGTPAGILAQAQRMLKDPKARSKVAEFHQLYAHMGDGTRWADIRRDPAVYPAFKTEMTPLLSQETQRLFDHIVFDKGGSFRDLLTTPTAFVNATLAPLYGLDPAQYGSELTQVELDPATRAGIFTRAGFLASYSLYNRPSPILRGAFLQKEVLCAAIGSPPPGVEGTPLPTTGSTNRERVDAQTSGGACVDCHHSIINPTGFAMEAFDAIGHLQTEEAGVPIDTTASVPIGGTTAKVSGPADLMSKIAAAPESSRCYAMKWVQYAYERPMNNQDACVVKDLTTRMTRDAYSIVSLITDLTQSSQFRLRAKELAQ